MEPIHSALFLSQGLKNHVKGIVFHTSCTVRPFFIHLLVPLATVFRMRLGGFHVTQVYLQSDTQLACGVCIEAPNALGLPEGKIVKV